MVTDKDIRAILALPAWTQSKLAERLGVTQSTVSKWNRGSIPSPEHQDSLRALIDEMEARGQLSAGLAANEQPSGESPVSPASGGTASTGNGRIPAPDLASLQALAEIAVRMVSANQKPPISEALVQTYVKAALQLFLGHQADPDLVFQEDR